MNPASNRFFYILLGFFISGVLLYLALNQVDFQHVWAAFSTVNILITILCAALVATSITLRSIRWRVIAGKGRRDNRPFFRATTLGYFGNLVLPLRAGELIKMVMVSRLSEIKFPTAVASAIIDRFFDLAVTLLAAGFIVWYLSVRELATATLMMSIGLLVLIGVMLLFLKFTDSSHQFFQLINQFIERLTNRFPDVWVNLRTDIFNIARSDIGLSVTLLLLLVFAADYLVMYSLLLSFNLALPLHAPLVLWVFFSLGSALPSAPGYIGVYQLAAVWALANYDVSPSIAVAVATVMQLTLLATATLLSGPGAWSIARSIQAEKTTA
jgi:hypothetical protein